LVGSFADLDRHVVADDGFPIGTPRRVEIASRTAGHEEDDKDGSLHDGRVALLPSKSILLIPLFVLLSSTAFAQSDDAAYCSRLGTLARRYIIGGTAQGEGFPDQVTMGAIADCNKGNTATGIKALEKKLRDNGFTLPKRS